MQTIEDCAPQRRCRALPSTYTGSGPVGVRSHMRFGCEWDSRLVALLLALNHSRALVTAYPPNYSPMQSLQDAARVEPSRLVALGFDDLDDHFFTGL